MTEKDKHKITIEKIEHIDERHCLIFGYRNGMFHAAAYEGTRSVKSVIADDLNAVSVYEQLRKWLLDKAKNSETEKSRKEG